VVAVTTLPKATTLDFAQIRRTLPHGPEMVLLDRVEFLKPAIEICAIKAISGAEPCYFGLDSRATIEDYAYPASLVLESFGQAAAMLWLHSTVVAQPDQVLMFVAARDCVFSGHAYPGDVLRHVARLEHRSDGAAFVSGHTSLTSGRIASYGSLTAVVRCRSVLAAPTGASDAQHAAHVEGAACG
jgi:3-hydroxyacyl-[acyl-carrier-protein] dehydratase